MPAIHINNVDIQVYEQQYTSPTLHVQNTDGKIYHAIVIPQGGELFDASETLVYSNAADKLLNSNGAINDCQPVTLDAGMYRVELRGGAGGKQSRCHSGLGTINPVANTVSQIFKLPTQTTVYAFRGGDGNNSDAVTAYQIPGGGASGVDSMLVVGDRAIIGIGAPSSQCFHGGFSAYPGGGAAHQFYCQPTPSGTYSIENIIIGDSYSANVNFVCGGGGGGAPNGLGGGATSSTKSKATGGENATSDGGGKGGDAENLRGDSKTQPKGFGGKGGKNVTYTCAGHTAVSYGGGGGGGACAFAVPSNCEGLSSWCYSDCANGGDGAEGSTGESDTSYVKIYKIG